MKPPSLPGAILALLCAAQPALGVDLAKIDRTIAKEPIYQTRTPKYCLLVFGPEAKTRMWLVLDGKVLYADRKGDGDLTGANQRVASPTGRSFNIGTITLADGKTRYYDMKVRVWKEGQVQVSLERKGDFSHRKDYGKDALWQCAGASYVDREWAKDPGVYVEEHHFQFADRPQDAPIAHFDGPLTLKILDRKLAFVRGGTSSTFSVSVGTPGLGKGAFTQILFRDGDPNGVAEIVFPHRDPKAKPIVVKVILQAPQ
jgi:hypothetical protein